MFLVVGLAIAGVIGIAAAFYFSLRPGNGGDKRLRSVDAGRAGTDRRPGSSAGTARRDRANNAPHAANGGRAANTVRGADASSRNYQAEAGAGPNPALDFGDPVLVGGRRGGQGTSADNPQAAGPRLAAVVPDEPRPRRRVGFRKGADVDEELWPTELFGGVSDEQFWDDLASDKPLTTTARTAHQDPGARNRPLVAVPPSAAVPPAGMPSVAGPPAATNPVQSMTPQVPGATQPVRTTAGTSQLMSAPIHQVNGGHQVNGSQPVSAAAQPAETRGRRRASRSDDEDPLTSAAFSLRTSGPVDGRSSRRSRDMTREQYDAAVTQETQTFTAAETEAAGGRYPGGMPPFRQSESSVSRSPSPSSYSGTSYGDPSSATQAMTTPSYGENYGYGSGGAQGQSDDSRRHNGTRSHARHGGNDEASRAARQSYPQDRYHGTGSYPAGVYQGTGSHQAGGYPGSTYPGSADQGNANGYRGSGHRAPYDPRDDYRRLTQPGRPSSPADPAHWSHARGRRRSGTPPAAWTRRCRGGR